MIKRILVSLTLLFVILMFLPLIQEMFNMNEDGQLSDLSQKYIMGSSENLNVPNVVTSIVVTYRGFDTLGEVTVLFLATAGVGFLLKGKEKQKRRKASELLASSSLFLGPLMILFGVYIFTHGHLTPGGGFQGGVLIASAFLLMMLSDVNMKLNHTALQITEAFSGVFYVGIGLIGIILTKSFLDPTFLPMGKFGSLFSAGAIPIIYSLVGLKVGAELTSILEKMRGE